ncbi:MAG: 16S rRNA (adenine(1518)-N(6)/adenine(1519)-N(6))-dimethyltransferase RsmA [Oscillospiraceae bacterium]|jgi:16S rRNA (adenine1518-N6/adenine1519-N6)-dimethyltransferase|nr:16S rRNA (adenine(1518)-N(6)/adenine(1519)-N(6))-dimethyltransferase RsmA [Oscillospiraceae bacterium]
MNLCDIEQIRALLSGCGFRFSRSMGQNFLTAAWVPERIAAEAGLDGGTGVLEVGPGIGCLTVQLSRLAGRVVSVELDRTLGPVLAQTLSDCGNTQVVFGDVLKLDLKKLVSERLAGFRAVVCANLPYNITSPLISAFIEAGCFETMTLMVQREVARRICARAGASDYGAFSVYIGWHTEPEILFDVSPECFMPRPKVWSSVVRLDMRKAPPVRVRDEKLFFALVKAAFGQRRKTLVNALSSGLPGYSKERLAEAAAACGLDALVRGETLGIETFAALSDALARS